MSGDSNKAVVLLSGGLDSATVLAEAIASGARCHALTFDYGQRHRVELEAAARVASSAATHRVYKLDLSLFTGSALTSDVAVPRDGADIASGSIPVTYVPARNLIFLSIALGYAETLNARTLHIGVNDVDYSGYPDCRPEFVESFARTANLATKDGVEGRCISIVTPLLGKTKPEIIRRGMELGVDYAATHSCYDPIDGLACGRCDSCRLRRVGFAEAGVPDPTRYAPSA